MAPYKNFYGHYLITSQNFINSKLVFSSSDCNYDSIHNPILLIKPKSEHGVHAKVDFRILYAIISLTSILLVVIIIHNHLIISNSPCTSMMPWCTSIALWHKTSCTRS